jgi:hypothetical protein
MVNDVMEKTGYDGGERGAAGRDLFASMSVFGSEPSQSHACLITAWHWPLQLPQSVALSTIVLQHVFLLNIRITIIVTSTPHPAKVNLYIFCRLGEYLDRRILATSTCLPE